MTRKYAREKKVLEMRSRWMAIEPALGGEALFKERVILDGQFAQASAALPVPLEPYLLDLPLALLETVLRT
jgi:hypothetical protein